MLLLSSCSLPGQGEPPSLYRLQSLIEIDEDPRMRSGVRLAVARPLARSGLDTSRIALSSEPLRIDYFGRVRWVQSAPDLIQNLLIESLRNWLPLVSHTGAGSRAHFLLLPELRDFQAELRHNAQPLVRLHMIWTLLDFPEQNWIAAERQQIEVLAGDGSLPEVITAFNEAWNRLLRHQLPKIMAHLDKAVKD